MTSDEYLEALRAAAHAGDRKAAAFLGNYAARLVGVPTLPTPTNPVIEHPTQLTSQLEHFLDLA